MKVERLLMNEKVDILVESFNENNSKALEVLRDLT
jgi:hypothetical protein